MDKTKIREIRPIFKLEKISKNLKFSDLISESKLCQNLICHKSDSEIFSVDSRHSHNTNLPRRRKISTAVKISWPRLTINLQLNWTFYNPTTVRELDVRHTYLRPARPDQIRIICSHADKKRNYDFEIMKMKGMKFIISSIYFCPFQHMRKCVG